MPADGPAPGAAPARSPLGLLAALWGVGGVLTLLTNAIVRLTPPALAPLSEGEMTTVQWGLYVGCVLLFIYSEGIKGFQRAFSPRVAARAAYLASAPLEGKVRVRAVLAPFFCMGLFGATKKRKVVSWTLLSVIVVLVVTVRYLPWPYRNIVDAGVVAGLSWGAIATLALALRALVRGTDTDPELPASG